MSFTTEIQPGVEPHPSSASEGFILNHCMLRIKDPAVSLDFYTRVFGMVVTDHGVSTRPGAPTMAPVAWSRPCSISRSTAALTRGCRP